VKYFGGAGGVCVGQAETPLLRLVSPKPGEIEIGTRMFLCSEGFADVPIDLEAALPDGTLRRGSEHPENFQQGTNLYFWTLLPNDPTRTYIVTVIQGERRAQMTFDVAPASRPRFLVRPEIGIPGSGVRFDLVGYPPDSDILLYVYKLERAGNEWYFHLGTTLPPAHTDSRGIATYTLPTQPDDEDGEYLIVTEPPGITPRQGIVHRWSFVVSRSSPVTHHSSLVTHHSWSFLGELLCFRTAIPWMSSSLQACGPGWRALPRCPLWAQAGCGVGWHTGCLRVGKIPMLSIVKLRMSYNKRPVRNPSLHEYLKKPVIVEI
jgi:hypothetical protein